MREEKNNSMKLRRKEYGDCNMVGKNIERMRKQRGIKQKDFISRMQTMGIDINPTSYSKLEGQVRLASDKEVYVSAKILNVTVDELFDENKNGE
jgi:transcriptional regulator with XRE-family HTH domain